MAQFSADRLRQKTGNKSNIFIFTELIIIH